MLRFAKIELNEFEYNELVGILDQLTNDELKRMRVDDTNFDLLFSAIIDCVVWEEREE